MGTIFFFYKFFKDNKTIKREQIVTNEPLIAQNSKYAQFRFDNYYQLP